MIITLTTDFGGADAFVGIMKGVILGISPDAQLVDLSHDIRSYDILEGALTLNSAWRHFPQGTIHLVVIDPGVGSARRPIAVSAGKHIFVGPDNGVLSFVLCAPETSPTVYHITNTGLFKVPVSMTFHGRDVFAPVAAHLASGAPIGSVGPRVTDPVTISIPTPRQEGENIVATVLRIDKFGNIVTNLKRKDLTENCCIWVGGREIRKVLSCYAEAQPGELFAIEGSAGYVEIALDKESAASTLNVYQGAEIKVETVPHGQGE